MARAERTLADTRAELERLRAELDQGRRERERLDQALRHIDERARAEALAAAERQQRLEAALVEARSEAQRLSREVGRLREEAEALPSPARTVVEPEALMRAEPASARPEAEPVAPAPPVAPVTSPSPGFQPASPPAARSGMPTSTLLLVDDDADFRAAAADMLRAAGYEVIEAGDGPSALERAQRHPGPIHLLVTDLMMPGMNGRQTAQRLATIRPGVGVLYISGYVDEAAAREAIAGEAADFLSKPFDTESFTAKVRDLLTHALRASA
jgi:CheY-like chemotaxis protein